MQDTVAYDINLNRNKNNDHEQKPKKKKFLFIWKSFILKCNHRKRKGALTNRYGCYKDHLYKNSSRYSRNEQRATSNPNEINIHRTRTITSMKCIFRNMPHPKVNNTSDNRKHYCGLDIPEDYAFVRNFDIGISCGFVEILKHTDQDFS